MSSILNSISAGDLLVPQVPRDKPVKSDSIADLLQSSDMEFEILPKQEDHQHEHPRLDVEIEFDLKENTCPDKTEQPVDSIDIENVLLNLELHCSHSDSVENFNTGFGENHDVYVENHCTKPAVKTPLYYENYLREFISEEDKAAARHALGLYNKYDVVAMSLLTAEDEIPNKDSFVDVALKLLRKGDLFFAPITTLDAIFDSKGNTLKTHLDDLLNLIDINSKVVRDIMNVSQGDRISSLVDIRLFLDGFTKETNLCNVIDNINLEMLKFKSTGTI